ncbi:hypothetical protein MATL_G00093650 [Megalops atlanticus]|uniref:Tetratricopeptide repeat domain 23 n=1 Tax=Megalops atlanticus TaxID=7932 RepID=A0A9D3Q523_MEGAT|nr:hypothetical protein MATL_G00093650 [Megalops atlanticus]
MFRRSDSKNTPLATNELRATTKSKLPHGGPRLHIFDHAAVKMDSDSNCKSLENCLAERRESVGDSSSGGSARSAHSEKGPSARSHGEAGETLAVVMMSPGEKLAVCENQAQTYAENQQFDAAIQELVRCLALVRLVHGDGHLKLAQAHAKLAQSYLQFKGWAAQAQEHSARALDVLLLCTPRSPEEEEEEKADTLRCLLSIHHTQGQSALLLGKYPLPCISVSSAWTQEAGQSMKPSVFKP